MGQLADEGLRDLLQVRRELLAPAWGMAGVPKRAGDVEVEAAVRALAAELDQEECSILPAIPEVIR
jgi:hypothetical protein